MNSKKKSLWLALLVVFALFAAACGGDDDDKNAFHDGLNTLPKLRRMRPLGSSPPPGGVR